jgi:hypothetical protein
MAPSDPATHSPATDRHDRHRKKLSRYAHRKLLRFGCSCPQPHLLFFVPFSRDPLADVCGAILELDAVRFAAPKKTDNVLIHQR